MDGAEGGANSRRHAGLALAETGPLSTPPLTQAVPRAHRVPNDPLTVTHTWSTIMPKRLLLIVPLLLALVVSATYAQDDTTVSTAEDPELGTILTDPEGMTLYLFTNDEPGVSNCYDQCEENWPVFTAEEPLTLPEDVPGELTLIERNDGTTQVAYNDWPLYYWVNDEEPGDTTGHEVGDVWFVVNPAEPGEMVVPGAATPVASPAPTA
jgi:predicted lipoprotein with Yx(FWY)xxD motif